MVNYQDLLIIKKAERELRALENTLEVVNSNNETYKQSFSKAGKDSSSSTTSSPYSSSNSNVSLTNLSSQESQHCRKVSKQVRRKSFSKFLQRNRANKLTKTKIKLYLNNRIIREKKYQNRLEITTPNGNIKITTVTTTQPTTTAKYYRIYQS